MPMLSAGKQWECIRVALQLRVVCRQTRAMTVPQTKCQGAQGNALIVSYLDTPPPLAQNAESTTEAKRGRRRLLRKVLPKPPPLEPEMKALIDQRKAYEKMIAEKEASNEKDSRNPAKQR